MTTAGEGEWYAGRPVLVMANDYALGLFNGDTGVVVRDRAGELRVVFTRDGELVELRAAPARRRADRARDDGAPQPGQPVRPGDIRSAGGGFAAVHPRTVVHRADPGAAVSSG